MTILTIVGARPQFIKAAVVSRALRQFTEIKEIIVHTGQHFDANMSDIFFKEMELKTPDYNLNISELNHGAMTGRMLEKIEEIILKEKPNWVLVFGDTNSTLAGALAAAKLHVKVAHVEAGLRSFNMNMPEEINRILTDRISTILFAPTEQAMENLKNEGFDNFSVKIVKTGDVMWDAATYFKENKMKSDVAYKSKILTTIHRAENTDNHEKLQSIFHALEKIAEKYGMILPLHPRTKLNMAEIGFNIEKSSIQFLNPVGYFEMLNLLDNCRLVITDSGGLQKEACFFKKPCVTLREETEWVELVAANCNMLAGSNSNTIINAVEKMISTPQTFFFQNLYGDGNAGKEIADAIWRYM